MLYKANIQLNLINLSQLIIKKEAEKISQVAKIQYDQKIMEKESEKKMADIEGIIQWAFKC